MATADVKQKPRYTKLKERKFITMSPSARREKYAKEYAMAQLRGENTSREVLAIKAGYSPSTATHQQGRIHNNAETQRMIAQYLPKDKTLELVQRASERVVDEKPEASASLLRLRAEINGLISNDKGQIKDTPSHQVNVAFFGDSFADKAKELADLMKSRMLSE